MDLFTKYISANTTYIIYVYIYIYIKSSSIVIYTLNTPYGTRFIVWSDINTTDRPNLFVSVT